MLLSSPFRRSLPRAALVAAFAASVFAAPLAAQTIRGTVTDDSTHRPVADAAVTLLDGSGNPVDSVTSRSDADGHFSLYTRHKGTYRVRVNRIGYSPATSADVKLQDVDFVALSIVLSAAATVVAPVTVIEHRRLSAVELDGRTGFDYRRARGLGHYLSDSDFVGMATLDDIVRSGKAGALNVPSIQGALKVGGCPAADVVLLMDGQRVASWEDLEGHSSMPDIAAVEVYNRGELVPGAAGFFGSAIETRGYDIGSRKAPPKGMSNLCVVLVWSKGYFDAMQSVAEEESNAGKAPLTHQSLRGKVLDFDTDQPVGLAQVSLLRPNGDSVGDAVRSDSAGNFVINAPTAGVYYLKVMRIGYRVGISPAYPVPKNMTTTVEMRVAANAYVIAPLTIVERTVTRSDNVVDPMFGFDQRATLGVGTFLKHADVMNRGVPKFSMLLQGIAGVTVSGDSVLMRASAACMAGRSSDCDPSAPAGMCVPTVALDGVPLGGELADNISSLDLLLPDLIEALEVYNDPLKVPAELASAMRHSCGVIAVWRTRSH